MLALRVDKKRLSVRHIPIPSAETEALVRVTLSGICNTDLEIARGYAGFKGTIGHEFVGVVEECADASLVGKRVVGEINAGCGKCSLCLSGDPRHCPTRTVLGIVGRDGAHAEYLRLPRQNLFPVPAKVVDEYAVFTEPLSAACGILEGEIDEGAEHLLDGGPRIGRQLDAIEACEELAVPFGEHRVVERVLRVEVLVERRLPDADRTCHGVWAHGRGRAAKLFPDARPVRQSKRRATDQSTVR